MSEQEAKKSEMRGAKGAEKKENGLLNILINVAIPSFIMIKGSKPEFLGPALAFAIAIAFPLSYGIWDYYKRRKINFFSGLGLVSVFLTGGIGLLKLPREYMVWKEAGVPLLMGVAVLISQRTSYPLVRTFLNQMLDIEKIDQEFAKHGHTGEFESKMKKAGYYFAMSFFLSSFLNYALATLILVGEPGSEQFTESFGKMTAYSYVVITVPMVIVVGAILFYLLNSIKKVTGLELEEVVKQ